MTDDIIDHDHEHEPEVVDEFDHCHTLSEEEWNAVVAEADRIYTERVEAEDEVGGAGDLAPMGLTPRYFDYDNVPKKSSTLSRRQLWVIHTAECPLKVGYAQSLTKWGTGGFEPRASWHRFVDPATVARWIPLNAAAWHAAGGNHVSVGYEQSGYASYSRDKWLSPDGLRQIDLLAQQIVMDGLPASGVRWLSDAQVSAILTGRDTKTTGLCSHEQVSRLSGRTTRTDPGKGYPQDVLVDWVDWYHPATAQPSDKPVPPDAQDIPRRWLLTEDGILDKGTRAAIQRMVGVKGDGEWGPATRKAIQRWASASSKPLVIDGNLGPASRKAVQRKVGAPVTGVWNYGWETKPDATTRHIEAYYNRAVRNNRKPI